MSEWTSELISLLMGLAAGGFLGSLVTLRITNSQKSGDGGRNVSQKGVTAGRDNIVGDGNRR